jgi:hypothetical protein
MSERANALLLVASISSKAVFPHLEALLAARKGPSFYKNIASKIYN